MPKKFKIKCTYECDDKTAVVIKEVDELPELPWKSKVSVPKEDVEYIVSYMNEALSRHFRCSNSIKKLIQARYNEGYTREDFITVIENMKKAWINNEKMATYLRPSTLFGPKFGEYKECVTYINKNRIASKPTYDLDDYNRYVKENTLI